MTEYDEGYEDGYADAWAELEEYYCDEPVDEDY